MRTVGQLEQCDERDNIRNGFNNFRILAEQSSPSMPFCE